MLESYREGGYCEGVLSFHRLSRNRRKLQIKYLICNPFGRPQGSFNLPKDFTRRMPPASLNPSRFYMAKMPVFRKFQQTRFLLISTTRADRLLVILSDFMSISSRFDHLLGRHSFIELTSRSTHATSFSSTWNMDETKAKESTACTTAVDDVIRRIFWRAISLALIPDAETEGMDSINTNRSGNKNVIWSIRWFVNRITDVSIGSRVCQSIHGFIDRFTYLSIDSGSSIEPRRSAQVLFFAVVDRSVSIGSRRPVHVIIFRSMRFHRVHTPP